MRKLSLFIATSLDGYIAKPNDDLNFLKLVEKEGEDYGYTEFTDTVDTILIGRKTYDIVEDWYNLSSNSNYVFSKIVDCTKNDELEDGYKFTEQDIRDNFGFHSNVSKKHYWNRLKSDNAERQILFF